MEKDFDAGTFFVRLRAGEFNGRLPEVLGALTKEQLEQVAALLAKEDQKANHFED